MDAEEGAERRGVQGLVIGRGMARVSGRGNRGQEGYRWRGVSVAEEEVSVAEG